MSTDNGSRESRPPLPKAARLLFVLSIVLSAAGLGGFVYLFVRDFNIYWFILSPIIIALYQMPAVLVFWFYKKRRAAAARSGEAKEGHPGEDGP
jgi:hypothetical protein